MSKEDKKDDESSLGWRLDFSPSHTITDHTLNYLLYSGQITQSAYNQIKNLNFGRFTLFNHNAEVSAKMDKENE